MDFIQILFVSPVDSNVKDILYNSHLGSLISKFGFSSNWIKWLNCRNERTAKKSRADSASKIMFQV